MLLRSTNTQIALLAKLRVSSFKCYNLICIVVANTAIAKFSSHGLALAHTSVLVLYVSQRHSGGLRGSSVYLQRGDKGLSCPEHDTWIIMPAPTHCYAEPQSRSLYSNPWSLFLSQSRMGHFIFRACQPLGLDLPGNIYLM